jgi:hypothetical protein
MFDVLFIAEALITQAVIYQDQVSLVVRDVRRRLTDALAGK